jgi:hypothetical protein
MNRTDGTGRAIGDEHRHAIRGSYDQRHIRSVRYQRVGVRAFARQVLANHDDVSPMNLIQRHDTIRRNADGSRKRLPRRGRG